MLAAIAACSALALAPAVAPAQERPVAETGAPTAVTSTSATLNGVVTPNGADTRYTFVYGPRRYDGHTAVASAGDGTGPVAVSATIDGLSPATTYHVRLIAFSRDGFDSGHDVAFATLTAAPVPAPVTPLPTPAPPAPLLHSAPSSEAPPPPVLGKSVNLDERSGQVTVKVPGVPSYVALSQRTSVPVGSIVDTRHGSVTLRTAVRGGKVQSAIFHGGLFQVRQPRDAAGLTELRLRGPLPTCGSGAARAAATAKRKRKPPRRLWGRDNHGRFRTRGGNSVATVRGTSWYVEDRCGGTLTRVTKGSVSVRDLRLHRTVLVSAGQSYLARAKR
ncbi:MAG TPA: fibronectin type III domain-containing protein [Solirubrobacteraceae bacterium]